MKILVVPIFGGDERHVAKEDRAGEQALEMTPRILGCAPTLELKNLHGMPREKAELWLRRELPRNREFVDFDVSFTIVHGDLVDHLA
jgi:hypothetical protein